MRTNQEAAWCPPGLAPTSSGYTPTPTGLCSCHVPSLGSGLHSTGQEQPEQTRPAPASTHTQPAGPHPCCHSRGLGTGRDRRPACAGRPRPGADETCDSRSRLTCTGTFSGLKREIPPAWVFFFPFFKKIVSSPLSQGSARSKGALLGHVLTGRGWCSTGLWSTSGLCSPVSPAHGGLPPSEVRLLRPGLHPRVAIAHSSRPRWASVSTKAPEGSPS